jgi:hypothetical protein
MYMRAYHITSTEEAYQAILKEGVIRPGRNVADKTQTFAHVSLTPPTPGDYLISYWLHKGRLSDERWIIEVEIPDDIVLEDDPATEEEYQGQWKVFPGVLPVKVINVEHVRDIERWNRREFGPYAERDAEDGKLTNKQVQDLFPEEGWSKFR